MIVVDTNVLVYAVRPGRFTEAALRAKAKDPDWMAPSFWRLEMANVLSLAIRVEGLDLDLALEAFAVAESLVEDVRRRPSPDATLRLTQSVPISAYDAEFVLSARRFGVPLVTTDKRLIKSFPDEVIPLDRFGGEA